MGVQQPQYQSLYRASIKEAAMQGAALMQATLVRALREWPDTAARMDDVIERGVLLEALAVLKERQQALTDAFPQALLAEFAHAIAGERSAALNFDALSLLGDEQVQENADLVRAARALEEAVQPRLAELEAALAAAQLTPRGAAQRHPLRPEVYVRAVYRLARQSPLSSSVRRRWLRHLPPLMAPDLLQSYAVVAKRIAPAETALVPAEVAQEARDRATQLTIRELQKLLAGEPGEGAGEALIVFDESDFQHTVPAALEMVQDMRKVDQLMLQLRQRQAAMPGREQDSLVAFRDALRQEARKPAQALAVEVVQLMMDNLAADERLLPQVREVVRDLEPPLLRLALVDPRFFSDREHPARQLLEQLTQRSLAWTSAEDPAFQTFMGALQEATEALLDTRASGPETFEIALAALEEAWDEAQPRGRRNRERAVRALLRAEQRNLLAGELARKVLERPDAAGAPPEALAFLTGPWSQVMAQARLVDGSGSEDPGGYGWVVQTVLWSVQPALTARVAGHQQTLRNRIHEGLASIDHLPADTQRWQNLLAALRDLAMSVATGTALRAAGPEPAPERVDTWLAPLEMHESGFVPDAGVQLASTAAEPDALPPQELAVGAYVDLLSDGWERWQLTWASPHGLLFMFTHASGATRSMTRRKLHHTLQQGALRLVSSHPVVDGALDAVAHAAWRNSGTA
ncbi:DUF1631 family protein [Ramlibacter pallidus]|uniref:DUF1631 family protein n=1 Tax=Ramlibacter pallidus TaxID=2780087 RepID=A0ABR9S9I0_9BURK|nr:DUF1631 family protein [Ramlibacter pallidus]MBE7370111.1 DUF1631 family protein [Ramlibacter pallidus]